MGGWVYIVTNKKNSVLYVGVTSDVVGRIWEHKNNQYPNSFTARYKLHKLVYCERFDFIEDAIVREKELKGWSRLRKENLVKASNPTYKEMYTSDFIESHY